MRSAEAGGDQVEVARSAGRGRGARRRRRWRLRRPAAPRPGSPRGPARSRPPRAGMTTMPSSPPGGSKRAALGAPSSIAAADHEAAVDRRGDVVGMALQLGRPGQHLLSGERQLVEVVGGEEAGDDRRGAGAEPAGERDAVAAGGRRSRRRSAGSRRRARSGSRGRSARPARPGRRRTRRPLRPPARGTSPAPPPSRRSPGRGWPRRRGRGRAGGARSSEDGALDRAEVVLAVDHRRRFARAPCRGP